MSNEESQRIRIISDPQQDRYARLHLIQWWDHERIRNARIMVVGAGALGNEVLKNLALIGVGHLFIVDYDTIEASNLSRSVLFRLEDAGRSKAVVAAERVRAINHDVHALACVGDVTNDIGAGVYRRMDIIISCLDSRGARISVNRACFHMGKTWVDGALDIFSGLIRVFVPDTGICYECIMTEQDYLLANLHYACPPGFAITAGVLPTLPTTASIIAALQVQEVVKLLHHLPVRGGWVTYFSGETLRTKSMQYQALENCSAHHTYEQIEQLELRVSEITVGDLLSTIYSSLQTGYTLYLPEEIVTSFYCSTCQYGEPVYRPYSKEIPAHVPCPRCATERIYDVTTTIASQNEHMLLLPVAQLGIPALHVFPVRTPTAWHYFELSGDEPYILNDW